MRLSVEEKGTATKSNVFLFDWIVRKYTTQNFWTWLEERCRVKTRVEMNEICGSSVFFWCEGNENLGPGASTLPTHSEMGAWQNVNIHTFQNGNFVVFTLFFGRNRLEPLQSFPLVKVFWIRKNTSDNLFSKAQILLAEGKTWTNAYNACTTCC